ncbi:MAG TPA: OmpA family protein [Gemmatimonadaceae bacterium]|nr:OmpA family protein [Gemmatimonadaceae bacterium]
MTRKTMRHLALTVGIAAALGGCRGLLGGERTPPPPPAAMIEARVLYQSLQGAELVGDARVALIRAEPLLDSAEAAVRRGASAEYIDAVSHLALRQVQLAKLTHQLAQIVRTTDSLRTERLQRLLALSEADRQALERQQRLSQQEILSLQQERTRAQAEADSLRRVAEEAHARLNQALEQLRGLIVEITNIRETQRGLVISLSDILFDVDRATLRAGADANVRRISAVLNQYPDYRIAVEGHTDATGADAYNQQLSERRAEAVRRALITGGVAADRITAHGFGRTQPIAGNDTPAGRQQNRRVEVIVLGAGTVADALADPALQRRDTVTPPPAMPPPR